MKPLYVWRLLLSVILVWLLPVNVRGADAGEICLQETERLQSLETEQCSGMSYLLNPSACFSARKALAASSKAGCREAGANEVPIAPPAAAPVASAGAVTITIPMVAAKVNYVAAEVPGQPRLMKVTPAEATTPQMEIDQLRSDVSALREELWQLKADFIRSGCRQ